MDVYLHNFWLSLRQYYPHSLSLPLSLLLTACVSFCTVAHQHLVVGRVDGRAARRWDWVLLWSAAEHISAISTSGAGAGQAYVEFGHWVRQDGVSFLGAFCKACHTHKRMSSCLSEYTNQFAIIRAFITAIRHRTARNGPTFQRRIQCTISSAQTIKLRNWHVAH